MTAPLPDPKLTSWVEPAGTTTWWLPPGSLTVNVAPLVPPSRCAVSAVQSALAEADGGVGLPGLPPQALDAVAVAFCTPATLTMMDAPGAEPKVGSAVWLA